MARYKSNIQITRIGTKRYMMYRGKRKLMKLVSRKPVGSNIQERWKVVEQKKKR